MLRLGLLVGWFVLSSAATWTSEEDNLRRAVLDLDRAFEQGVQRDDRARLKLCSDEEFVRRAYLEIIGRIPTAEECAEFFEASSSNKRGELIDALLEAPGHTSRMFHFYADLLRVKTKLNTQVSGSPYIHWLKTSISEGKHYDDIVRELLTAEGPAHKRDNGATGYYLRDRGMPEDNMANTLRAFLGTRLECAQCHDHPFDQWTRKQFFEMAAFTGGISYRARIQDLPNFDTYREMGRELRAEGGNSMQAMRRMLRPTLSGVYGSGTGLVKLPKDYQYDDASPQDWIIANALFGDEVEVDAEIPKRRGKKKRRAKNPEPTDSREAFAEWIVSPTNPFFTKSIANRLWKQAMGQGLIEPVDEIDFETEPSNPELLASLERLMVEVDYDLDEFQRVLYRTNAWQAEAVNPNEIFDATVMPPGPLVRRMSAEQVWDSLLAMMIEDLDAGIDQTGAAQAEEVYETYETLTTSSPEKLRETVGRVSMRMSDQEGFRKMKREERKAEAEERKRLMRENRDVVRRLARARRQGDEKAEAEALAELRELGIEPRKSKLERDAVRASELPSPAPNGHFLRQFGQSDHEQIDGSHTQASVPQVLSLLNGAVEKYLIQNDNAYIAKELRRADSAEERMDLIFLSVLGREATKKERDLWKADFKQDKTVASQDLLWTLVNSHEFLFVR